MQEAQIEKTPEGQVPADDGWFIRNLGELAWETVPGFGVWRDLGVGLHVHVLQPGEAPGYYHAEEAGRGSSCSAASASPSSRARSGGCAGGTTCTPRPAPTHITVGSGDEPCAILMFGSPDPSRKVEWIADETAARPRGERRADDRPGDEAYGERPEPVRARSPQPFAT